MANQHKEFGKIYDKHIEKIYRFVLLKVNSKEIAEDITSTIFLRGWEAFKIKSREIENIQAFLYQIARNLIIDYYREKAKVQFVSIDSLPIIDPKQNLEEKALLESDIKMIRLALINLKDDYQNVIIWHYLDDLPISETARLLDRTEEATRVLLHRALKALRERV